jgi:pimeloyl-ACP methyl ester carboxylesterase
VHYATVTGATLGYRVAGRGAALVLVAGSSNTMAEWDPRLLDALARDHRVIIFDNRGAGTSTGSVDHLTIALMAHDTEQLISQVTRGRADVLAWSMGGFIAQKLAIAYPQRVHRLVLASTDCGGAGTQPPTPRALRILTDPNATQAERMSILFPKDQQAAGAAWGEAIGAAFAANGYKPESSFTVSAETARAQTRAAGQLWLRRGGGTCSHLDRITQPTLVAAGRRDVISPVSNHEALVKGIAGSTALVYDDAGHAFLFQPELGFGAAVNGFLRAH